MKGTGKGALRSGNTTFSSDTANYELDFTFRHNTEYGTEHIHTEASKQTWMTLCWSLTSLVQSCCIVGNKLVQN